jgi:hypothetical protein
MIGPRFPSISIIIATYNRAPVLRLALESVQRQTFDDWEALVIGDGCTDGSADIVAGMGDSRFHWHNLPTNSGSQAAPNNLGLELARGRWVAYLGHDDLWFPWRLERLVKVIKSQKADFAYSLVPLYGKAGLYACWGAPSPGAPYSEHNIAPSAWLHSRRLAVRVGGWADPHSLDMPVDFHLSRRMALAGARFAYDPRLSVLKFPSPMFTTVYRNESPLPQSTFHRKMILDSEGLEREVLQEIANFYARLVHRWQSSENAAMLAGGGSPESVARYQAERSRVRQQRGLDDIAPEHPGSPPVIRNLAATRARTGRPASTPNEGTLSLSVTCHEATPETFVLIDGVPLASSVHSPELVMAVVPDALLTNVETATVQLLNRAGASGPEILVLNGSEAVAAPPMAGNCSSAHREQRAHKHNRYRRKRSECSQ